MIRAQAVMETAGTETEVPHGMQSPRREGVVIWLMVLLTSAMGIGFAQTAAAQTKKTRLPYVTIDHAQFLTASEAAFLSPNDLLIGVTDGKPSKAYPAAILAQHGVVQGQMADGPIAGTWRSYCNTALVFRAAAQGTALVFDTDGLIGGNEVFKDRETGSRWQQSSLQAISGPLKGTHLALYSTNDLGRMAQAASGHASAEAPAGIRGPAGSHEQDHQPGISGHVGVPRLRVPLAATTGCVRRTQSWDWRRAVRRRRTPCPPCDASAW